MSFAFNPFTGTLDITGQAASGGSGVQSVSDSNPHVPVDNTDPQNPIVDYLDAIPVTYSDFITLKSTNALVDGKYYITDAV